MSKYTITLKEICESLTSTKIDGANYRTVIDQATPLLFNFPYTLFDPLHKTELERKIVMNYLPQEIGFQSAAMFAMRLDNKMNQIMPEANNMYKAQTFMLEPMSNNKTTVVSVTEGTTDTTVQDTSVGKVTTVGGGSHTGTTTNHNIDVGTTHDELITDNITESGTIDAGTNGGTTSTHNTNEVSQTTDGKSGIVDMGIATTFSSINNDSNMVSISADHQGVTTDATDDVLTTVSGSHNTAIDNTTTDKKDETSDGTSQMETTGSGTSSMIDSNNSVVDNTNDYDSLQNVVNDVTTTVTTTGRTQSEMELVEKYRQAYENVDNFIISSLGCLFMQVF